jgi:hypothetical protein
MGEEHETLPEYYHVHDEVWSQANMEPLQGELCVGCLEKRLGRKLHFTDFSDAKVNYLRMSDRLSDRRQIWSGHERPAGLSEKRGWAFPYGNFSDGEEITEEQIAHAIEHKKEMDALKPKKAARDQWIAEQLQKSQENSPKGRD